MKHQKQIGALDKKANAALFFRVKHARANAPILVRFGELFAFFLFGFFEKHVQAFQLIRRNNALLYLDFIAHMVSLHK